MLAVYMFVIKAGIGGSCDTSARENINFISTSQFKYLGTLMIATVTI